jgi:transcriptional regulator NrdR family protein
MSECDHLRSKVIDSRPAESNEEHQATWRRRQCLECKARWNTWEIPEEEYRGYLEKQVQLTSTLDGLTKIHTQLGLLLESEDQSC